MKKKVETLLGTKNTVDRFERGFQLLSDKYDEVLGRVKEQGKDISDPKKKIGQVEKRIDNEEVKDLASR